MVFPPGEFLTVVKGEILVDKNTQDLGALDESKLKVSSHPSATMFQTKSEMRDI